MKTRRKSTDELLEDLLEDDSPERPLTGPEILSMLFIGNTPLGRYETELCQQDGSVEIESFVVGEGGEIVEHHTRLEQKQKRATRSRTKMDQ